MFSTANKVELPSQSFVLPRNPAFICGGTALVAITAAAVSYVALGVITSYAIGLAFLSLALGAAAVYLSRDSKKFIKADVVILARSSNTHELYFLAGKERSGRGKDNWTLPGGQVDKGETAAEAALREFGEECHYYDDDLATRILTLTKTAQVITNLFNPGEHQAFFVLEVDAKKADAIVNTFNEVAKDPSKLHSKIHKQDLDDKAKLGWINVFDFVHWVQDTHPSKRLNPADAKYPQFYVYSNLSNPEVLEQGKKANTVTKAVLTLLNGRSWGTSISPFSPNHLIDRDFSDLFGKTTEVLKS